MINELATPDLTPPAHLPHRVPRALNLLYQRIHARRETLELRVRVVQEETRRGAGFVEREERFVDWEKLRGGGGGGLGPGGTREEVCP